jgi:hypothetical protein
MSLAHQKIQSEQLIQKLHCALKLADPESLTAELIRMAILNEASDDGTVPLWGQPQNK